MQAKRTTWASFGNIDILEVEKSSVGKKCVLGKFSGLMSKKGLACAGAQCRVAGFLAIGIVPSS